eukprot:TRINITY_DN4189_c0_g2_i1.p1 TRINITY_DN4189_c0_g2~~TRINITY_DN4189_c0_g2_i1.p1  ORF type:complete len:492 (-),score=68.75 TRINITY_DN4189_c0_g2_i1:437-1762(-)
MEFAVFDRWHASMTASTQPNRMHVHSATSHGATGNHVPDLIRGFPQKTIFDSIHEDNLSFGIYFQSVPSVFFLSKLRQLKYIPNYHPWAKFKSDAKAGKLPNYSFLEPKYFDLISNPANDDHPSHDVSEGQRLLKEVYETLRASPQWKDMLLIITYDEHGGFYDHVPTPTRDVPSPDGIVGPEPWVFEFDRVGVRVPTIMVSPWINKGTVVHSPRGPMPSSVYEHSSVPATLKKLFNLKADFLTKRDEWAGTFEHIVMERDSPRTDCPEELPSPPWSLRHSPANEDAPLTEWQSELVQLAAILAGEIDMPSSEGDSAPATKVSSDVTTTTASTNNLIKGGHAAEDIATSSSSLSSSSSSSSSSSLALNTAAEIQLLDLPSHHTVGSASAYTTDVVQRFLQAGKEMIVQRRKQGMLLEDDAEVTMNKKAGKLRTRNMRRLNT